MLHVLPVRLCVGRVVMLLEAGNGRWTVAVLLLHVMLLLAGRAGLSVDLLARLSVGRPVGLAVLLLLLRMMMRLHLVVHRLAAAAVVRLVVLLLLLMLALLLLLVVVQKLLLMVVRQVGLQCSS